MKVLENGNIFSKTLLVILVYTSLVISGAHESILERHLANTLLCQAVDDYTNIIVIQLDLPSAHA